MKPDTAPPPPAKLAAKRARGRPRKTVDERDEGNRRQALISAAATLFRRKGFNATTTRDIAAAVGMQSGSPFYHFKSKDALLYAVMEEGMRWALAHQHAAMQSPGFAQLPPAAQLHVLVRAHFEVLLGPGSDFVPVMLYESRALSPRQQKALARLSADYEALWLPVLTALHATGQVRAPVRMARLLILGALNWSVQWYDPKNKKSVSLPDLADAAMALFLGAGGQQAGGLHQAGRC